MGRLWLVRRPSDARESSRAPRQSTARGRAAVVRPAWSAVLEPCESRVLMSGTSVYTYHDDVGRTGADLTETQLTPTDVAAGTFGLQHTLAVDGQVYAQPLYVHGVSIGGVTHNVVYVATEHDSVYAFDSDTGRQLWVREYTNPAAGLTTPTSDDVGVDDIYPEVGITGTPVIDPSTGTLYFVTKLKQTAADGTVTFEQFINSVDVATGADKLAGSVMVQANLSGSGAGYTGTDSETVPFDALTENQRPALLLSHGDVYVGYSSHGDNDPYHGWLFAFNATTLATDAVVDLSPDGLRAPIWMGGAGPSADAAGDLFVSTGNGTYDAPLGGFDYGDSVLRIDKVNGYTAEGAQGLKVEDYFTPDNQAQLNLNDKDLGSGGVLLVPGTREAITGGKDGDLYVVNQRHLGKFHPAGNDIIQRDTTATGGDQIRATPAYFNKAIYLAGLGGALEGYKLVNGRVSAKPIGTSAQTYANPGATPSISANGTADGIVWAIQRVVPPGADAGSGMPAGYAVLNAYDATTLKLLYSSATDPAGGGTNTPPGIKFSVPTIADGHVFVGTASGVLEYGLTPTATALRVVNAATHAAIATITDGSTVHLPASHADLALEVTPATVSPASRFGGGTPEAGLPSPHLFDRATAHAGLFAAGKHTISLTPLDLGYGAGVGQTLTYTVV